MCRAFFTFKLSPYIFIVFDVCRVNAGRWKIAGNRFEMTIAEKACMWLTLGLALQLTLCSSVKAERAEYATGVSLILSHSAACL